MEDERIVDLYWDRDENAITQTEQKYGKYCHQIAFNVLKSIEDSEECVNDTWNKAWNSMPDARPLQLRAFLGKICRNLALDRYRGNHSLKRGSGQMEMIYEELEECVGRNDVEDILEQKELERVINDFVAGMKKEERVIFVRRYWYMESVKDIARNLYISEAKVKTKLFRSRKQLADALQAEGIVL